jgi:hypothetical protein
MGCPDCKTTIYNYQKSVIPKVICQGDCPEEVNCNGEVTYTDCVVSNVALSCIEKSVGATQTEINQAFDAALCANTASSCYTWTELTKGNLGLGSKSVYAGSGFEKPAVSDVRNCIVRLAGTMSVNNIVQALATNVLIGTLPVGKRPNKVRKFSVNIPTTKDTLPIANTLTILTNGEMYILCTRNLDSYNATVSLDSISFETGTII